MKHQRMNLLSRKNVNSKSWKIIQEKNRHGDLSHQTECSIDWVEAVVAVDHGFNPQIQGFHGGDVEWFWMILGYDDFICSYLFAEYPKFPKYQWIHSGDSGDMRTPLKRNGFVFLQFCTNELINTKYTYIYIYTYHFSVLSHLFSQAGCLQFSLSFLWPKGCDPKKRHAAAMPHKVTEDVEGSLFPFWKVPLPPRPWATRGCWAAQPHIFVISKGMVEVYLQSSQWVLLNKSSQNSGNSLFSPHI